MRRNPLLAVLGLATTLVFGCGEGDVSGQPAEDTAGLSTIYEGVLPCADCEGIRTVLTLTKDGPHTSEGTFVLGETYLGRGDVDGAFASRGVWTTWRGNAVDENAIVVVLNPDGPAEERRYYERMGEDALRLLDRDLRPIESELNYTLTRS